MMVEVAKQVPALTVLGMIVWLFLKQLSESRRDFILTMREIHAESIDARDQSREVIRENTAAAKETNLALQQLTSAVKSLERETQLVNHK